MTREKNQVVTKALIVDEYGFKIVGYNDKETEGWAIKKLYDTFEQKRKEINSVYDKIVLQSAQGLAYKTLLPDIQQTEQDAVLH